MKGLRPPWSGFPYAPLAFHRSLENPFLFGSSVVDTLLQHATIHSDETNHQYSYSRQCKHYDRLEVSIRETPLGHVHLEYPPPSSNQRIPLGRARAYPSMNSTACPATVATTQEITRQVQAQAKQDYWKQPQINATITDTNIAGTSFEKHHNKNVKRRPWKPFVQLSVVALILTPPPYEYILVTRRPSYMRSFPHAWVLPGGTLDADDDDLSLANGLSREVFEETGLEIPPETSWKVESMWESLYPTIPEPHVPIKHHHLVVFLSTCLPSTNSIPSLQLCPEEVDGAVWLSFSQVQHLIKEGETKESRQQDWSERVDLWEPSSSSQPTTSQVALQELMGIYPQDLPSSSSSSKVGGIAQGSLFALKEFLPTWAEMQERKA